MEIKRSNEVLKNGRPATAAIIIILLALLIGFCWLLNEAFIATGALLWPM